MESTHSDAEKKSPDVAISETQSPGDAEARPATKKINIFHRLPIIAIAEFSVALLSLVGAVVLIACINKREAWPETITFNTHWGERSISLISPTVILSLIHSLCAFLIALGLKDGITIAWWRKALLGGTVKDLDKHYKAGTSLKEAALAGKSFGIIALATLAAATVGFSQGPLLQRSLNVVGATENTNVTITAQISLELPNGYTGLDAFHDGTYSNMYTPAFEQIMKDYGRNTRIHPIFSGCNGTCQATIHAAGLAAQCTTENSPVTVALTHGGTFLPEQQYFGSRIDYIPWYGGDPSRGMPEVFAHMVLTVAYLNVSTTTSSWGFPCKGTNITQTCVLRPAILEYPVIIQNNTVQLDVATLDPAASPFYPVVQYTNVSFFEMATPSTLGGIQLALNNLYQSQFVLNLVPTSEYPLNPLVAEGTTFQNYLNRPQDESKFLQTCSIQFTDPVPDILAATNEIMFRTAIASSNASTVSTWPAAQARPVLKYTADFAYLAAAIVVTVVGVLLMLPTFWGYWELDRKVSLNPIELAEAFNAPVLRKDHDHRDYNELIEAVGDRAVKYQRVKVQLAGQPVQRMAIVNPVVERNESVSL